MTMMRSSSVLLSALLFAAASAQEDCYASLDPIVEELGADDVDLVALKRFVLCPDTVFDIGVLEPGVGFVDGQSALTPRNNTEISCGEDGASTNNCLLKGGSVGVFADGNRYEDAYVSNVVFKGLTFEGQDSYGVNVQQAGDFHFIDCVFQNSASWGTAWVNYEAPEEEVAGEPTTSEVYFEECMFKNNTQRVPEPGVEFGIVTIRGDGAHVEVDDCIFQDNLFGDFTAPLGYAVSVSNGAELVLKNSCLIGNQFLGAGPVLLNEETFFVLIGNHATMEASVLVCQFAAWFSTEEDRVNLNPQCVVSQSDVCKASIYEMEGTLAPTAPAPLGTPAPTTSAAPSTEPSTAPSRAPIAAAASASPSSNPSSNPTAEATSASPTGAANPTRTPTRAPTRTPTRAPTRAPTRTPTRAPTRTPTRTPTRRPTGVPSPAPTRTPTRTPTKAPTGPDTDAPTPSPTADTDEPTAEPIPETPEPTAPGPDPTAAPVQAFEPTFTPRRRLDKEGNTYDMDDEEENEAW